MAGVAVGKFNKSAIFKRMVKVSQGAGTRETSATNIATVRGFLRQTSGSRNLRNGQQEMERGWEFTTWFVQAIYNEISTAASSSQLIVEIEGRQFQIGEWNLTDEKQRQLQLRLAEIQVLT